MLRVIRSIWIWIASASLIFVWIPLLGIIWLFDRDPRKIRTGRWFRRLGRNIARVNPWRLHVSGADRIRPGQVYIVVANHQSLADVPLMCYLRIDAKWLAKVELFRFPVTGILLRMAGDIPVDRSVQRKAGQALVRAARAVRSGVSLVFYPEGSRSRDGSIQPFNDGPFRLAVREQIPLLPLVIDGSGNALPRNSFLFGPALDIYLRVLEPVSVQPGMNAAELRDRVREMMIRELERMRASETELPVH